MQARLSKRERKSELRRKSVNGCQYIPRKKRRIFWPQAGNELKKMGAVVVSFDISWPLDEVVYEQMECLLEELTGKLCNLLWITFYQNNFIRILPSFFAQTKILNFTMGKTHGSYFNLLCQTPGSGKCFLKIPEFSYNFHFILRRIMW